MRAYLGLKRKGAKVIFVFLAVTFLFASHAIGGLIPNSWLKTLVLIEIEKEVGCFEPVGTGFLVARKDDPEKKTILVTNAHIFDKNTSGKPLVIRANKKNPEPNGGMFGRVPIFPMTEDRYKPRFHDKADLAILYVRKPSSFDIKTLDILAIGDTYFLKQEYVPLGDEVFLIGFPTSIHKIDELQKELNIPILRGGVIAAKYQENDLNMLLIDAPSYWGGSGGPVVIRPSSHNITEESAGPPPPLSPTNVKLIGIVSSMLPVSRDWELGEVEIEGKRQTAYFRSKWHSGLSTVVPIDYLIELIDELPD